MTFLFKPFSNLRKLKSHRYSTFSPSTSTKISTGLTGLLADSSARSNLLKLYAELRKTLSSNDIPDDYVYKKSMLSLIENRTKLIENELISDLILEEEIGEGQLEELIEQAQEESELANKLVNEWKPWNKQI